MMRNAIKRLLAISCVVALLMTTQGITVLAEDIQAEEEIILSEAGESEEAEESIQESIEEDSVPESVDPEPRVNMDVFIVEDIVEEEVNQNLQDQVVGDGDIRVGPGVTATYDEATGAVEFYSNDGTLDQYWSYSFSGEIKSIKVASGRVYLPPDSSYIFATTGSLTSLDLSGFDTSYVVRMDYMFYGCSSLTSLDLSSFDTSNVTNMDFMFCGCSRLESLDLGLFYTPNVASMDYMFDSCDSLKYLDLSTFDTSKVTDMTHMFFGCSSLTTLDLSSFDTTNVESMSGMFNSCVNMTSLDLSSFDTRYVTDMCGMFASCSSLAFLDLGSFDTRHVTDMSGMFSNCASLPTLDLGNISTLNVTNMDSLFYACSSLTSLDLSGFNTSRVENTEHMFQGCSNLTSLNLSSFNTLNVTSMTSMFYDCRSLASLDLSSFDTSNITSMENTFYGCSSLTSLDLSGFDTSYVVRMDHMFNGCSSLTSLDLSSFDTSNVESMVAMFYGCSGLMSLDLSSFDMSNMPLIGGMFYGCSNLQKLKTPKNNVENPELPNVMYDSDGKEYTQLPTTTKSITLTSSIGMKDISNASVECISFSYIYSGAPCTPELTVKVDGLTLKKDTDYTVEYVNNINHGTATIIIRGMGTYTGYRTETFVINPKDISNASVGGVGLAYGYSGKAYTPELTVKVDGLTLKKDTDYMVEYVNNVNVGTATIIIRGIGNYTGYRMENFKIVENDISEAYVEGVEGLFFVYSGMPCTPALTVKVDGVTLKKDQDYTVEYVNNVNVGTATITITGIGNYAGYRTETFEIKPKAISNASVGGVSPFFVYSGMPCTPALTVKVDGVTLKKDTDYTVKYVNNKNIGTANIIIQGIGNYTGYRIETFEIEPKDISNASVGGISLSYGYSGKAYTPALTVKVDGVTLKKDTDYTVKYVNNKNIGTANIIIQGIGNYTGYRIKTFEIVDCVSSLVSGKTYQLIPKNNSKTAVCSFSGKMVNNTRIYITDRSSSEAMKFKAIQNADGTWKFINAKCELALAVQQNSNEVGKGLVLYDQTTRIAQNWKLSKKSDNSFAIINAVSGLSIAMSDESAVKGTTLSMAKTASVGLQRFYIAETSAISAPYDGTKSVRASKDKNFGLNIASSSKDDNANVNLNTYSNTNAKKFKIMYSGGGYYRLVNVNSGLCLTVKGNTSADGANVIQSKWAAQSGQRWKITKNSDGTVTLTNALGTVLHLTGNKTANGTNIVAKNASTSSAQKWYLQ